MTILCCVVEDDERYARQLESALFQWAYEKNCRIKLRFCGSIADCLKQELNDFSIFFLDIKLSGTESGVELAHTLRERSYTGDIIFLTSYTEYVFSGYSVGALDYLIKPIDNRRLRQCMNRFLIKNERQFFIYKSKNKNYQIRFTDIIYIQSNNHSIDIITNTKHITIPMKFQEIQTLLPSYFARIHRTLLVNVYQIDCVGNQEVIVSNMERLPVSRTYSASLNKCFLSTLNPDEP